VLDQWALLEKTPESDLSRQVIGSSAQWLTQLEVEG
jgi:hypothetical protein